MALKGFSLEKIFKTIWLLLVKPTRDDTRGAWWRALLALAPCGLFYVTMLSVYTLFYKQFYASQSISLLVPSDEFLSLWGPMISALVAFYLCASIIHFLVVFRVLRYSIAANAVVLLLVGLVYFLQLYMSSYIKEIVAQKMASGDYMECPYNTSEKFDAKAYASILVASRSFNGCPASWPPSIYLRILN